MFDVALLAAGASVSEATSSDPSHPPENMLDGDNETFWTTTGLYPQHFVISFAASMLTETVKIKCANVKDLKIERSVQNTPECFEAVQEIALLQEDGQLQTEEIQFPPNFTAQHLKFTIRTGHDHFAAVYRVHVNGRAVHE